MRRAIALFAALMLVASVGCSKQSTPTSTGKGSEAKDKASMWLYCGGSMRLPIEEIKKLYEERTGRKVEQSFGDSGSVLTQAQETGKGDLFVVHDPFGAVADSRGLTIETAPVANLGPAIAVKIGSPAEEKVKDLKDLAQPGLKVGVPDYEHATCGNVLNAMLDKRDFREALEANVTLRSRSSGDLVNALGLGAVDAIVAWDALIRRDKSLKLIPIAKEYNVEAVTSATDKSYPIGTLHVTISVLKTTVDRNAAREFVELATGPDGQAIWAKHGFDPVEAPSAP